MILSFAVLLLACAPQSPDLDKAFTLAENHLKAQRFEAAVAALRGAGADASEDGAVRTRYGVFVMRWTEWRIQSGEVGGLEAVDAWFEAADVFAAAARLRGAGADTFEYWSESLLNANDPPAAEDAADDGLAKFADAERLLLQRGRVRTAMARKAADVGDEKQAALRYAAAESDFRAAMAKAPKSGLGCVRLGEMKILRWVAAGSQDPELRREAVELWTEAARRDPGGLDLGNAYAWLQGDADAPMSAVLERQPENLDALWFRGLAAWARNPVDWPTLRDDLRKVLEKNPGFADANFYLADGAVRRGTDLVAAEQPAEADQAFAAGARFWAAYLEARMEVYAASVAQGEDRGAALAERMTWLAGKAGPSPFEQGYGLPAEAATIMAFVVRLTPDDGYAWQNLGFFRRESRAYEDARAAYARAYQLLPEDPQVMNDYAVIHHYYLRDEDALVKDLYREAIQRAQAMLDGGGLTESDADRIRTALRDATDNLRKIEAGNRENG